MKHWPFRYQMILVGAIPALLTWLMLTFTTLYTSWGILYDEHLKHGEMMVTQMAPSCEFAIFSGDMDPLNQLLDNVVSRSDVEWIELYDNQYHLLTHLGSPALPGESDTIQKFTAPVYSTTLKIDDVADGDSTTAITVGYLSIGLSNSSLLQARERLLYRALTIGGVIITVILLLVSAISRRLTLIFHNLHSAMGRISRGDFSPLIEDLPKKGELGELSEDLQKMASALERNSKEALTAYELLEKRAAEINKMLKDGKSTE